MGAIGLGLSPLALATPVRETVFGRGLASATKTRPLMGTLVTVTVLHPSQEKAIEAMEKAFSEMERIIPLLDRHAPDTPVADLNRRGYLKDIPVELSEVLQLAQDLNRLTGGSFDITVKPILDLFEDHFSRLKAPPPLEEIQKTLSRVGAQYIEQAGGEIRFRREGMGISLDGIAKGYVVDRAGARLRALGIRHGLINAGGDILALGDKGNGQAWRIAIQSPWEKSRILQVVPLAEAALATSGDYENYFDPERKFHHIINPQSGFSPQHFTSVSVLAKFAAMADGLATAMFIPPTGKAKEFLLSASEAKALWVDRRKMKERSAGWPEDSA